MVDTKVGSAFDYRWLGSGGREPGVDVLDSRSARVRRLLDLPRGHSVYALAGSGDLNVLAAGTRAGEIHVLKGTDPAQPGQQQSPQIVVQRAPVLSVCFAGGFLVASDTAGRCLRWDLETLVPAELQTNGAPILSFLELAEWLVGLSADGVLLFWSLDGVSKPRVVPVPVPPARALVPLLGWPADQSLAYPAQDGSLVVYNLATGSIATCLAHPGGFIALAVSGEDLISVGRQDGLLKRWRSGSKLPVAQLRAPAAVISALALNGSEGRLVLVNADGGAGIYQITGDRVEPESVLPSKEYRLAAGTPVQIAGLIQQMRAREEAQRIVVHIRSGAGRSQGEGFDTLHQRLVQVGYEHISLALQADQAHQAQDLLSELRARQKLVQMLPDNRPDTLASLRAYVSLLERLWSFEAVEPIEARIRRMDPDYGSSVVHHRADALEDPGCILQPDQPVPVLVEAATVLGRCFNRRCCLNELEPMACSGTKLSPEQIADKYQRVRLECATANLPGCRVERAWWVLPGHARREEMLVLFDGVNSPVLGLGLVYQVRHDGLQTVVVPAVLFDAGQVGADLDSQDHNGQVMAALNQIHPQSLAQTWLAKVDKAMTQALRRLVTQNLSGRHGSEECK